MPEELGLLARKGVNVATSAGDARSHQHAHPGSVIFPGLVKGS
jgi:hypothetical protein